MPLRKPFTPLLLEALLISDANAMTVYVASGGSDWRGLGGATINDKYTGPVSADAVIFIGYDDLPDAVALVDVDKEPLIRTIAQRISAGECDGGEDRFNDFLRRAASTAYSIEDIDALWTRTTEDVADDAGCWPNLMYEPWPAAGGKKIPAKVTWPEYGAFFYPDERGLLRIGTPFTSGLRGSVERGELEGNKKPGALASIHSHPTTPGRYESMAAKAPEGFISRVNGEKRSCHTKIWEFAKLLPVGSGPSGDFMSDDLGRSDALPKPSVIVDAQNIYLYRTRERDEKLKIYTEAKAALPRSLFTGARPKASGAGGKSCFALTANSSKTKVGGLAGAAR